MAPKKKHVCFFPKGKNRDQKELQMTHSSKIMHTSPRFRIFRSSNILMHSHKTVRDSQSNVSSAKYTKFNHLRADKNKINYDFQAVIQKNMKMIIIGSKNGQSRASFMWGSRSCIQVIDCVLLDERCAQTKREISKKGLL